MKTMWCAAMVALALAVTPAVAADIAQPAVVKRNATVRGGPTNKAPAVGQITNGAPVEVLGCTGAWCQLAWPGQAFVPANCIVLVPQQMPVAPTIAIAPPQSAPLVYAAPAPVLFYPPPPRYYGPPPMPGPLVGGVTVWTAPGGNQTCIGQQYCGYPGNHAPY
ncbi:SH3 domain-containing protein [Azorhizobium doebereinerae]|uniref:SH3 domain-containing protein n=1 Tax=Azorhizobium doebereinerae TaxID=281091 RepID=UPI0018DEC3E4|nr:SH3 domain-containing protein [Azorhizobium doebereinerae]